MAEGKQETGILHFGQVQDGGSAGQVYTKTGPDYNEASWQDGGGGVSDHGSLTGLTDDDHAQYGYIVSTAGNLDIPDLEVDQPYFGSAASTAFPYLAFYPEGSKVLVSGQSNPNNNGVYVVPADWSSASATLEENYETAVWQQRGVQVFVNSTNFYYGPSKYVPYTLDAINYFMIPVTGINPVIYGALWTQNLSNINSASIGVPGYRHMIYGQTDTSQNGVYVEGFDGSVVKNLGLTLSFWNGVGISGVGVANYVDGVEVPTTGQLYIRDEYSNQFVTVNQPGFSDGRWVPTGDYTLSRGDEGRTIELGGGSSVNVWIPAEASVNFKNGTIIYVNGMTGGINAVTGVAGVTVHNAGSVGVYETVSLRKRSSDEWIIF